MTGNGAFWTAARRNFPQFSDYWLGMSKLSRSEKVIFWEIKIRRIKRPTMRMY